MNYECRNAGIQNAGMSRKQLINANSPIHQLASYY